MSKCFWSYNHRLITTVQQHENLQLIVASQVYQLWQHVVTHSNPVCLHQQTTVAKYPFHRSIGGRRTISCFMSDENRVFMVASPRTKTETRGFQDQDQDSEVPRPRPRPRLVKKGLETKTQVSRTPSLSWRLITLIKSDKSSWISRQAKLLGKLIPETGWCLTERAVVDPQRGRGRWIRAGYDIWRTSAMMGAEQR